MRNSDAFLSIVIPTLNEEMYLPRLLEDLDNQIFKNFEVIQVDAQSTDKTVKLATSFQKKIKLRIEIIKERNVSKQRNFGAKLATGGWIIFMDADNRIDEKFLLNLANKLINTKCYIFTCWMNVQSLSNVDAKIIASIYNLGIIAYQQLKKPTAVGALIGIRRQLALRYSFDEDNNVFEDTDFVEKVTRDNFKFQIFKKPSFTYSFRRFEKDGLIKILSFFAQCNLYAILGKDLGTLRSKYKMNGGSDYQSIPKFKFFSLSKIRNELSSATKSKKLKLEKLIRTLIQKI